MRTIRDKVYTFLRLPYVTKYNLGIEMGMMASELIYSEDSKLSLAIVKYCKELGFLDVLWVKAAEDWDRMRGNDV
jgi:hypothetical protein